MEARIYTVFVKGHVSLPLWFSHMVTLGSLIPETLVSLKKHIHESLKQVTLKENVITTL